MATNINDAKTEISNILQKHRWYDPKNSQIKNLFYAFFGHSKIGYYRIQRFEEIVRDDHIKDLETFNKEIIKCWVRCCEQNPNKAANSSLMQSLAGWIKQALNIKFLTIKDYCPKISLPSHMSNAYIVTYNYDEHEGLINYLRRWLENDYHPYQSNDIPLKTLS